MILAFAGLIDDSTTLVGITRKYSTTPLLLQCLCTESEVCTRTGYGLYELLLYTIDQDDCNCSAKHNNFNNTKPTK